LARRSGKKGAFYSLRFLSRRYQQYCKSQMIKLTTLLLLLLTLGCTNSPTVNQRQRIEELESELASKNERIEELEAMLPTKDSANEPEYWYAFEPTTEHNIVKLGTGKSKQIDAIDLVDSVDVVYTFRHETTIDQMNDKRTASFLQNYSQFEQTFHGTDEYDPMVDGTDYNVRTFVICEEDGLPIETENCTDNIYILVQPTELGYESNLFRVSRLFNTEIKSQLDTKEGVILTLEHSRFPRKELKVLIRPELVKFIK
jgi:hypothetical protein